MFKMTESEIFLCLNGYSMKLAEDYLESPGKKSLHQKCKIFYDPQRSTPANLAHIRYFSFANIFYRLYFLVLCIVRRSDSFYFPHTSGGRLQKLAFRFANKAYFIEDGLDTYRNTPLNINLSLISNRPNYLCLNALASFRAPWVQQFNLIEVDSSLDILLPPKQKYSAVNKAPVQLQDVERQLAKKNISTNVLIESQGIRDFYNSIDINFDYCIQHPNKYKSILNKTSRLNHIKCNHDASIRLLKEPLHEVTYYIGETLLLLYLFRVAKKNKSVSIVVFMSHFALKNYSSLVKAMQPFENVSFVSIGVD